MSSAPPPPGGGGDGRATAAAETAGDPPPSSVGARALAAASSREDIEATARAAMPPPPPRPRPLSTPATPVVLEEEQWTAAIEAIVERDYFPELPRLQSRLEWLRAVRSGDPAALRQAQANAAARRAGLRTPGPESFRGDDQGRFRAETPLLSEGGGGWWTPVSRASSHTAAASSPGGASAIAAATPVVVGGAFRRESTWGAESVAGDGDDESNAGDFSQRQAIHQQQQLRAPPVSLDAFLAGHTSEDNASFEVAMEAAAVRRLERLEGRFGPVAAAAAAAAGTTRDLFIGGAAGAPAVAAIEAAAAGGAAPPSSSAGGALVVASAAGGGRGAFPAPPAPRQRPSPRTLTNASATRFAAPQSVAGAHSVGASTFSGADSPMSGSGGGSGGLSLASGGSGFGGFGGGGDSPFAERGRGGNGASAAAAAAVPRQYRRLETPNLLPGGGGSSTGGGDGAGASPFITWGELAATPVRLDEDSEYIEEDARALAAATAAADGGPRFSMPAPRQRERLAATLRRAGTGGGRLNPLAARGGGVRGGPPATAAAPSPRMLSPAALRLASTLGRRSATPAGASDFGLRASYGGGGGGGRGATPLLRESGRRSASATPLLPPPPPPDRQMK